MEVIFSTADSGNRWLLLNGKRLRFGLAGETQISSIEIRGPSRYLPLSLSLTSLASFSALSCCTRAFSRSPSSLRFSR